MAYRTRLTTHDYASALEWIDKGRNPSRGRRIDAHTRMEKMGNGDIDLVYYYTTIVRFHSDGTYMLNSGGFTTVATSCRIASVLKFGNLLGTYKGRWLWGNVPFYDGMKVGPQGQVLSDLPESYTEAVAYATEKLDAAQAAVDKLHEDPVFHAAVRLGAFAPSNVRADSTYILGKQGVAAMRELALRYHGPLDVRLSTVVQHRVYQLIRKGEL